MLRNKRILLILILALALFLIPSICNAATIDAKETTKTSTGKTVKWSYELDGESIINLKCTNKSEVTGTVNIPSTIDGYTVTALGDKSWYLNEGIFYECAGITGVVIPNTVVTIGEGAFYNCKGLQSVTIPNSVITIGDNAFTRTMVGSLTIPNSVVSIGAYAFDGCSGIKELKIPESVVTIGDYAFKECSGMKSLTIQSNVLTTIGKSAFKGCVGLGKVIIPNNVTTLGESAFYGCSGLTSVTLSNNLTRLEQMVFYGCSSLTSVIIPDSVTTIDGYDGSIYGAFQNCTRLEKVLIPDSVAFIEKSAFRNCPKLTIYGNDGQTSKRYAEENDINFDYIANWNNAAVGDDITPPALKDLKIEFSHSFEYDEGTTYYLAPTGMNISIKASFEEEVVGNTAPTLTIKCGNGENIALTNGVIQGEYIVYTYTIKNTDKGIISAVSMTGGDIKDKAGNSVEKYTCPKLTTSYIIGENFVFANGTDSIVDNQENNNNNNNSIQTPTEDGKTNTDKDKTNDNKDNATKDDTIKDTTIKNDSKLPQTGVTILSLALISLIAVAIISKVKYGRYKDI